MLERFRSIPWRSMFEHTRSLRNFLLRISLVTAEGFSAESGVVSFLLAKRVLHMVRRSGLLFTALYLKQCSTALMKYYASGRRCMDKNWSGTYVSLSRAGIPTITPYHHRHIIQNGGERADRLVRLYLSLFSICRVVKLAKPISKATFSTITDLVKDMQLVIEVMSEIKEKFSCIWPRYLPDLTSIPCEKGFRWMPTWKSVPNDDSKLTTERLRPSIFTSYK